MPRTYVKKLGGRPYINYRKENMEKAIEAVKKGMPKLQASRKFKVPRTTLINKCLGQHSLKPGRPCVLTSDDEYLLAKTLGTVNDWGFPMTHQDIRQVVAKFVTRQGRVIRDWKDNQPGLDFIQSFASRNNLTTRLANNIKRQRAAVGKPELTEFFNNIKHALENVLPDHIYNYDETNITDDPGAKKVLVPRGTKRVERVQEHSRTSVSLMVCGTAKGDLLPPMVVYKAQHLYENWTAGGPVGTAYDVTPSGWFDMVTFEKWFFEILMSHINTNSTPEQKKVVIGDNLASHFSPRVIEAALANNIYMTPLPAHSTHLMQPLDVSFFAPMKRKWRSVLDAWRKESRRKGSIPKEQFPTLLNRLWCQLEPNAAKNLQSGFRTTGLSPFGPEVVFAKIPSNDTSTSSERDLDSSLLEFLQESRGYSKDKSTVPSKRGKKITTRPGQAMQVPPSEPITSVSLQKVAEKEVDDSDFPPVEKTKKKGKPKVTSRSNPQSRLNLERKSDEAGPSKACGTRKKNANTTDDSFCSVCTCSYENYSDNRDWICCVSCLRWVCGICNLGSDDPQYECPACNACSICLMQFSDYTNRKAWIKCVTCGKWVCGFCNGGSKQVTYECAACLDDD